MFFALLTWLLYFKLSPLFCLILALMEGIDFYLYLFSIWVGMAKKRVIDRRRAKKLARERMDILFGFARDVYSSEPELARRYVSLARRIGSRCNVRLTAGDKLSICRDCNAFLVPGVNCRVRTHARRVVVTCLDCGGVRRVPVTRERRGKLNKAALVNTG